MKLHKYILGSLIFLGLATGAYADNSAKEFIRYKGGTDADSGLQIAVTDYVCSGTTITLYGVVHVADADYYQKVQTDLDKFDVVLYEGVKQGTKSNPETKVLNTIQKLMGEVLDLKFQKDGIDYTRKNLVHADISMDELQDSLKGESITPFGQYLKTDQLEALKPFLDMAGSFIKELMKQSPEMQMSLKSQLAQQLSNADVSEQLSPEMKKAIVLDRNKIVIDTYLEYSRSHPDKKNYAVFYGAAHMPDLETQLQAMGFTQKSKRWMTAWKVTEIQHQDDEDTLPRREPQDRKEDK